MKKKNLKYDIFISYRRDGGKETAKHLRDILVGKGYSVFFDTDSLRNGDFNLALLEVIENCKDFIIILSPNALDRCVSERDWVRQELAHALKTGKNIVPVKSDDFHFPETLPEDIGEIRWKNAVAVDYEYFDAMVEKLVSFLDSKPKKRKAQMQTALLTLFLAAVIGVGIFVVTGRIKKGQQSSPAEQQVAESQQTVTPEQTAADEQQPAASDQQPAASVEQSASSAEQTAVPQENTEQAAAVNTATHKWGDYSPSGTAIIETVDGTQYTAIANSLVLKTDEIESTWADILYKGLDNPANDQNSDDSDLISFAEMESVTRNGDKLDIIDIDGQTTSLNLLDSGEILFIGEQDTGAPMSVYEKDIRSITFDRNSTPPTEIKYCTVKLDSGSYRSPVAFLWFTVNTNEGHGMPSMYLCQELSTYSGIPLPVKRFRKLTVTKNGTDANMYVVTEDNPHPDQTEMTIELTTGEEANITTGHYFIIYTMAKYGAIQEPSYSELREIEME